MPPELVDQFGNPLQKEQLLTEQAGPTTTMVRQVMPEHPSWGLSPEGLAAILRGSESHDPSRYYALCDDVEEREWHYRGVLSQRRTAVAQLPITVDPASDDKEHIKHADFVRSVVMTADFMLTLTDLGDALGKGMSFVEIVWDTSEGQWKPARFELRETTWFRYDQKDLRTPLVLDEYSQPQPLWPAKWITHRARLKTGIPVRDGLTRAAVWAWMFKNFDIKAWMIFLNKYGQPLRYGTYPTGAKREERLALLSALRNIGLDASAIVPQGMTMQFVEASAARGDAFQGQATYLDEQLSKLTVGQTGTTDASKGGYAVGRVHQGVSEAICSYDGVVLASTLSRDLIKPMIDFNYGRQNAYPRLRIGLAEAKDLDAILKHIWDGVDRGLKVEASQIYPMMGLTEPKEGDGVVLLKPAPRSAGGSPGASPSSDPTVRAAGGSGGGDESASDRTGNEPPSDSIDVLAEEMAGDFTLVQDIRQQVSAAIEEATSFDDLKARIDGLAKGPAGKKLVEKLGLSMFNARLAGELGAPIGPTEE